MNNFFNKYKGLPKSILNSGFGIGYVIDLFTNTKRATVYRFYWGRGGVYKQAFHISIFILTVVIFISGLSNRVIVVGANSLQSYDVNSGNMDLLQQGTSLTSVLAVNPTTTFRVYDHRVEEGETVQSIADKYGVSKDTVKWANMDKFGDYIRYTEDKIFPGEIVRVPEVSGVLHDVKDGDTIDSIVSKTEGDKFTAIELNRLDEPNYSLAGRKSVLVPDGKLNPPAKPAPAQVYIISTRPRPPSGDCGVNGEISGIALANPLCHPDCNGYVYQRGFTGQWPYGHDGVDLSKIGGCPISSMCDGVVSEAGWDNSYGIGYKVKINCGNGIEVMYYHGDGNIWVSAGQGVSRGEPVMYMGMSGGTSTGVHAHFMIRSGGVALDPAYYVGY